MNENFFAYLTDAIIFWTILNFFGVIDTYMNIPWPCKWIKEDQFLLKTSKRQEAAVVDCNHAGGDIFWKLLARQGNEPSS